LNRILPIMSTDKYNTAYRLIADKLDLKKEAKKAF
jgi:hypothetical protein